MDRERVRERERKGERERVLFSVVEFSFSRAKNFLQCSVRAAV